MSGWEYCTYLNKERKTNFVTNYLIERSLGCVLYELIFLTLAFPKGQFGDPAIPSKVSSCGIFSSVIRKYFNSFI